ncbi:AAA family ATPase [Pseudomaricurvus alkylphenolicus]|jgi:chromosome partitioning protein|uniref:AAA family ATPase n=1 Tax=Pseudomaricurvus alkylphenolicus TaxID=1306991 RepID=UPI00141E6003|nr:AAA family ATPase [Pseudomaricurvus alkylphenolicus]NIB44326.1 AAA family ATPase [Pseudomaricurvus alkylphenolicus]
MALDNLQKIEEVDRWIDACGDYLEGQQEFANEFVEPRRYKGNELVEVVGVTALATIHTAEKEGRLPPPDLNENNRRLGATLGQVLTMQDYFGTSPCRQSDDEPQILSFINFKGGCYKSTTALYAGSYYANLGYRVLLVDLDPQASLTLNTGLFPDVDSSYESSLAPYIIEDVDHPLENVEAVVRKTHLPNMDIIPACLDLAGVEFSLSNEVVESRITQDKAAMAGVFFRVREALSSIKYNYDLVILDGTPSLGLLPLNIILASDTAIVPVPTEATDFASTRSFCKLYKQQAEILNDAFGDDVPLPDMFVLPTRYSPSEHNATVSSQEILNAVREIFNVKCLDTVIRKHESVVSNLSFFRRTVFDVNAGDCNVSRDARKKAIANFSTVFNEILEKAVFPHWESKRVWREERGIV